MKKAIHSYFLKGHLYTILQSFKPHYNNIIDVKIIVPVDGISKLCDCLMPSDADAFN